MNTKDNWTTVAEAVDPLLKALWTCVFGRNEIPVKSITPQQVKVDSIFVKDKPLTAYMLDFDALSDDQQAKVIDWMAKEFGQSKDAVREIITSRGVPIDAGLCNAYIKEQEECDDELSDGFE